VRVAAFAGAAIRKNHARKIASNGSCPVFAVGSPKIPTFRPAAVTPRGLFLDGTKNWGDCRMKGNGRLIWMIGAMVALGFAAPSQAAVSAGNILAASATVDNVFRQELRVQMAATDARAGTAKPAVDAAPVQAQQASDSQASDGKVAASDQLSDADRALRETPPAPPVAVASNDAPAQRTVAMAGNDHSLWDETSLIGKVFIAFGTLLTIASAARMFMA